MPTYHSAADAAIDAEVRLANVEGREVELTDDQLTSLGHKKRPLLRVIHDMCSRCMCGSSSEIRRCTSVACPLYPYRLGRNPYTANRGNPGAFKNPSKPSTVFEQRADFSPETDQGTEAA